MGLPRDNADNLLPSQLAIGGGFIPKGAKNVEVSKDFAKYVIQPEVANAYLKGGLGRWLPAISEVAKTDPFWLDPKDQHVSAYTQQGLFSPTVPQYPVYNPGYAEVEATQIWGLAEADVLREGMTPQAAAEKALKRIEQIFAKYPIAQT